MIDKPTISARQLKEIFDREGLLDEYKASFDDFNRGLQDHVHNLVRELVANELKRALEINIETFVNIVEDEYTVTDGTEVQFDFVDDIIDEFVNGVIESINFEFTAEYLVEFANNKLGIMMEKLESE